jgi:hypothetical protein
MDLAKSRREIVYREELRNVLEKFILSTHDSSRPLGDNPSVPLHTRLEHPARHPFYASHRGKGAQHSYHSPSRCPRSALKLRKLLACCCTAVPIQARETFAVELDTAAMLGEWSNDEEFEVGIGAVAGAV